MKKVLVTTVLLSAVSIIGFTEGIVEAQESIQCSVNETDVLGGDTAPAGHVLVRINIWSVENKSAVEEVMTFLPAGAVPNVGDTISIDPVQTAVDGVFKVAHRSFELIRGAPYLCAVHLTVSPIKWEDLLQTVGSAARNRDQGQ